MADKGSTSAVSGSANSTRTSGKQVSASPPGCRLTSLIPELRNRIWELVLIESSPVDIIPKETITQEEWTLSMRLPGIVQTSQRLRAETLPVFLAGNDFQIPALFRVYYTEHIRLGALHPHVQAMRSIGIDICKKCDYATLRLELDQDRTRFKVVVQGNLDGCLAMGSVMNMTDELMERVQDEEGDGVQGKIGVGEVEKFLTNCLLP